MTNTQTHCQCPASTVKAEGKYHFSVCPGRTKARLAGQVPMRFVRADGSLSQPVLPKDVR